MDCANCEHNDGVVYTSMPPKYRCTVTNEFHLGSDACNVEFVPIVRCKDCKHKPTGSGVNHDVVFQKQDYRCPCRCEDFWYSWMPDDDWFCGNGERREDG